MKPLLWIILALLIVMQFFRIDKTNPEAIAEQDFISLNNPPEEVALLIKNACYDCHSHHTVYPWYSNIAPISFILKNHVDDGRKHLNFSIWSTYPADKAKHKLEECFEEVGEGEMPLKAYPLTHPEAQLTDVQRELLVSWFKSQYESL